MTLDLDTLRFVERGLLPAIAQDAQSGRVLMVAFANREAVERTLATGEAHFWSRSRNELWRKGATSGNVLVVERIERDCDGDALLFHVVPQGPACHRGSTSCFDEAEVEPRETMQRARVDLTALERIVIDRAGTDPAKSYTARLLGDGLHRVAQKVGEEATEVVIAAVGERGSNKGSAGLIDETADLLYHLTVLLRASGVRVAEVEEELARRHGDSPGSVGAAE